MDFDTLHYFPKTLPSPKSSWAVFIDRDGVIWGEKEVGTPFKDYDLYPGASEAIAKLNKLGIYTVVITNQARVARGLITETQARKSNQELEERLAGHGAHIDLYLYCPHSEFADVKKYQSDCNWRKPGSGMLEFVGKNLGINLKKSFIIGDQARDYLAGKKVRATSIGVKTGKGGKDEVFSGKPDVWRQDLFKAVEHILSVTGQ